MTFCVLRFPFWSPLQDSGCVCRGSGAAGSGEALSLQASPRACKRGEFLQRTCKAESEVSLPCLVNIRPPWFLVYLLTKFHTCKPEGGNGPEGHFWATLVFPFRHCLKIHHWRINNYLLYFLHLYLAFVGSICLLGIFVWVLFVSVLGFF